MENTITGAKLLIQLMEEKGVEVAFGYPGGSILPFYDELLTSKIKHYLVRHEQGAAHMAEGYARATGKIGVVIATSGPGATNIVTGIADAKMDSIPILAITGQVITDGIGTDFFQEADIFGISIPITKYNALMKNVNMIPVCFEEAWRMALGGRPGPVLLDFPKDIQAAKTTFKRADKLSISPHHYEKPKLKGDLQSFANAINKSQKPLLYVGGGAISSQAHHEIKKLAEKANIPVVLTLNGIGGFPGSHELCLGMLGMHGTAYANKAVIECDYILNLGARFDDRVAKIGDFANNAVKAHIDIDTAEFNKRINVEHKLHGDLKDAINAILPLVEKKERTDWLNKVKQLKKDHPLDWDNSTDSIKPQDFINKLYSKTKGKTIITTDVGQHQMWAALHYHFDEPNQWITSGGLGTMGFGLPAAIGAKVGRPDKMVICISGDGSIQMNIQELATMTMHKINVKIIIFNNNFLGMVRQWQELFYDERYSNVEWTYNPDFVKLANAYDIQGLKITKKSEIEAGIEFLLKDEKSAILEIVIPSEEKVFPMIPAGKSQSDMIEYKDLKGLKK